MEFVFNYKNVKASNALNEKIQTLIEKIKFFNGDGTCHVVISEDKKKEHKVEVTIISGSQVFRAEARSENFYKSADEVYDKIKKQVSRYKDKLITKRHCVQKEIPKNHTNEDEDTNIERVKRFKLYPMNVEDAILHMNTLDHNFFVYLDAGTGAANVVYKRNDGGYGIIETY